MAGKTWNSFEWLEIAGHDWKLLEIARNGWKWLELAKLAGNG